MKLGAAALLGASAAGVAALLLGRRSPAPVPTVKGPGPTGRPAGASEELARGMLVDAVRRGRTEPVDWTDIEWAGHRVLVGKHALSVLDNGTHLRLPVSFKDAVAIARARGWALPTAELADAIWSAAPVKLRPAPQSSGPEMTSLAHARKHSAAIDAQIASRRGELASPEGKHWILSVRNTTAAGAATTYGWHQPNGKPIQPLGPDTARPAHNDQHFDYSQTYWPIERQAVRLSDGAVVDLLDVFEARGLPRAATLPLR
jgi:hypothetical protein